MPKDKYLRDTFGDFLAENGDRFKEMVVLDADLSSSTRTYKFAEKYPKRFFDFGIAEQNMVGAAMGFAISGKIPIVSGFSIFTTGRAWEFIRMICHDNLNVKIITTHGGIVGEDGSSHNALEDLSLMSTLPNLTVLVPADNIELRKMLEYAINNEGPYFIRLPRESFPLVHSDDYQFLLGKPDILKDGTELGIIGVGYGSSLALKASETIEKERDLSIKVINQPTLKPIEKDLFLSSIKPIEKLIIIEEHNNYCGAGSILARIISEKTPKIIKSIGIGDSFGESGSREEVLKKYNLDLQNVIKKIQNFFYQ